MLFLQSGDMKLDMYEWMTSPNPCDEVGDSRSQTQKLGRNSVDSQKLGKLSEIQELSRLSETLLFKNSQTLCNSDAPSLRPINICNV